MSQLQTLITSSLHEDEFTIVVRDFRTKNILTSFKTTDKSIVSAKCLALVGDHYLVCTYRNSAVLNVWSLTQKDNLHRKIILPKANPSCLAVSPDSKFIVVGIDTRIYIWQLQTGRLLNILEKHYQTVTNLAFTGDGSRFISTGQDSIVHIWDFPSLIVASETFTVTNGVSSQHSPIKTIQTKCGAINDLHVSSDTSATTGHFAVALQKGQVGVYTTQGKHLAQVMLSADVRSIVMDRAETRLFVGLVNGEIYETLLAGWTAADGSAQDAMKTPKMIDLSGDASNSQRSLLKGHTSAVTALSVSADGSTLVSAGMDQKVMFWHIGSRQCLQTIQSLVANLIISLSPSALFVFDSLDSQQNLELATSNVSNDISFSNTSGGGKNSKNLQRSSTGHGHLMKLPVHPPPTIATELKRTFDFTNPFNFEGTSYNNKVDRKNHLLNAFDQRIMLVDNNCTDIQDIEEIFDESGAFDALRDLGTKRAKIAMNEEDMEVVLIKTVVDLMDSEKEYMPLDIVKMARERLNY